jgi:hypothetical protein
MRAERVEGAGDRERDGGDERPERRGAGVGRVRERRGGDEGDQDRATSHTHSFATAPDVPPAIDWALKRRRRHRMADATLTWLGHAAFRIDTPGG